jgi:hypothetical protein
MSTIKTKGFDSPEQVREYLEELDDVPSKEPPRDRSIQREIAVLRGKIEDLKIRVEEMQEEDDERTAPQSHGWLRAASAIALTFVVGHFARRIGLGRAGALATPLVVARLTRRMWPTA